MRSERRRVPAILRDFAGRREALAALSALAVVLVLAGFGWRTLWAQEAVPAARVFRDTGFYFEVARNPLWSRELWAGFRSPLPALFFKACALDPERIRAWQTALSVLSWCAFALVLSQSVKSLFLRPVAAAFVLTLGASRGVAQWNHAVLSESLSFSTAVSCLACSLMLGKGRTRWLWPTIICALAFASCRDGNAYLVLMLAGVAGVVATLRALRKRSWFRSATLAVAFVAIFVLVNTSANAGRRWEYPLTNVVVSRVLPDPELRALFESEGMPLPSGPKRRRPRRVYASDPSLAPFRDWISTHGKGVYERFLLSSPEYLFGAPAVANLLGGDVEYYAASGMRDAMPGFVEQFWSAGAWFEHLAIVLGLCVVNVAMRSVRHSPLTRIGLCLAVLLFPHALVVWHGDSMEVARHEAQVVFQLRVSLILLLLALADRVLQSVRTAWSWAAQQRSKWHSPPDARPTGVS